MKSGLYAWAGASATASAAAWAKRLDEPITKESKVYFGFMPAAGDAVGGTAVAGVTTTASICGSTGAAAASSESSTRTRTARSSPVASLTTACRSPRKWPSIHSRVKLLGTATTNPSSPYSAPWAWENQVVNVVSFSAPRNRLETSAQRVSAVSSIGRSTRGDDSLSAG